MDFSNEVGGMNLGCGRLLVVPEKKTEQMPVFRHNGEAHNVMIWKSSRTPASETMKLWNYTPWTGISLQLTLTHACGIEKTMWKLSAAYFYHTSVVYGGVLYQLILVAQNSLLKTCFDFCFEKEKPWINGFYYQVSLLTNSLMYKNSCVRNISIWLQWLQKLNIWVIKGVLLQLQVLLQSVNENLL